MCKAHPHTKGSCYHCIVNGLPCFFLPQTIIRHGSTRIFNAFRFQRNCTHCTQSHQKCLFDTDSSLQCKRCIKLEIPCLFKLSSQGSRNDLNASTNPKDVMTMLIDQSTKLDGIHFPPKPLDPNGRKDMTTMLMKSDIVVCNGQSTKLDGGYSPPKPLYRNGRSVNANESVHYHHCSNGYSCHGRVEPVTILDLGVTSTDVNNDSVHYNHFNDGDRCEGHVERSLCPPSWVHVFAKSTRPSSIRTQAASIAYIKLPVHKKKVWHRRNRRSKKKLRKQQNLLTEVIVPPAIKQNLLSESDIDNEIIVVDGGDNGNPSIRPPDCLKWRCLSVLGGNHLYVADETDPCRGLTFARVDSALPFIRLPREQSLSIIDSLSMRDIVCALEECEKLKKTAVKRSDGKRIFGDYGKPVMYTCVGVQVSRNSREVLNCNAVMEKLPECHWHVLMKLMRHAEYCFQAIADNEVISHLYHAKQVVPFKTMSMPSSSHKSTSKYYGGLAFGCNVFLRCHTDNDFTMSMVQIHLKGKVKYNIDDDVVVYFCFPTLGVAVPLRPGDFLLFNALIPHCVSSRCRQANEILSIAMYLKTSVVGMNNNQLPPNSLQIVLANQYRNAIYN